MNACAPHHGTQHANHHLSFCQGPLTIHRQMQLCTCPSAGYSVLSAARCPHGGALSQVVGERLALRRCCCSRRGHNWRLCCQGRWRRPGGGACCGSKHAIKRATWQEPDQRKHNAAVACAAEMVTWQGPRHDAPAAALEAARAVALPQRWQMPGRHWQLEQWHPPRQGLRQTRWPAGNGAAHA